MGEDDTFEDPYDFDGPEEPEVIENPKVVEVEKVEEETRNAIPESYSNIPSLAGDKPCTMELAADLVILHIFIFE